MDEIEHLLTHGVDTIYPSKEALEKELRSGRKLTLYQGFDPTGSKLHIGHAVAMRKLREFQELGHTVIFLIGDGTGQAGDPSGKKKSREYYFSTQELRDNAVDYVKQASKIVRFEGENPVQIRFNGDWLNTLTLKDILDIAGHFTLQQMLERDMYQERLKENIDVNLREFLYPLLQGYDSVQLNVDLEIGGTDQTFNMLQGRKLVKAYLNKEKYVITVPLLTDSKGVKIGKTEGNAIGISDDPSDFYAKIMSLGDDSILNCFSLLTDASDSELEQIKQKMDAGENPIHYKKQLAYTLTKQFNSESLAQKAQEAFEKTVQGGEVPTDIPEFSVERNSWVVLDLLIQSKLITSRSEGRRLIEQRAVEINNTTVEPGTHEIMVQDGDIVRVGKRKYIKIVK